jgi:hypothetical protein
MDTFVDLLRHLTEEYCHAYRHADFSDLSAEPGASRFARGTMFNWVHSRSETALNVLNEASTALVVNPFPFENPSLRQLDLDLDPMVQLCDSENGILCSVFYPASRFSSQTMVRFGAGFLAYIQHLLRQPEGRLCDFALN